MRRSALVLLLAVTTACGSQDPGRAEMMRALDEVIATCSAAAGEVQVKRKGEGFWARAQVGSVFRAGDWIQSPGGFSRIDLIGGASLDLDETTQLMLDVAEGEAGGKGAKTTLVAVQSGEVRGVINSTDESESNPVVLANADGSQSKLAAKAGDGPMEFRLTRRQKKTEVAVSSGKATLAMAGNQLTLNAGSAAEAGQGSLSEVVLLRAPSWGTPKADARVVFSPGNPIQVRWEPVEGAARYRLQIAKDAAFRSVVVNREVEGNEYAFSPPATTVYHWHVASRDSDGHLGTFSAPRKLFVDAAPAGEHLLEPISGHVMGQVGNAPIRVAFRWAPESGITQYRLVVAKNSELERGRSYVAKAERFEVDVPKPGTYYWGVFTDDAYRRPLFLQSRSFTVKKIPASALKANLKEQSWGE